MDADSRDEILGVLRLYIQGRIDSCDLSRYARGRDFWFFEDLCDQLSLARADFDRLDPRGEDVTRRVRHFLEGRGQLAELRSWVSHLTRILSSPEYEESDVYRPDVDRALTMLSLVLDPWLVRRPARREVYARIILQAMEHGRPVPNGFILGKLYRDLKVLHLASRRPDSCVRRAQWADVVLLEGRRTRQGLGESRPFVPFSVNTLAFWQDGLGGGPGERRERGGRGGADRSEAWASAPAWTHPENDKIPAIRERHHELGSTFYDPIYFVDPDGLAEIIIDADAIGRPELVFASRLFCLHNGVQACYLDGKRIRLTRCL